MPRAGRVGGRDFSRGKVATLRGSLVSKCIRARAQNPHERGLRDAQGDPRSRGPQGSVKRVLRGAQGSPPEIPAPCAKNQRRKLRKLQELNVRKIVNATIKSDLSQDFNGLQT